MAIIDTTARAWKSTRDAEAGVFIDKKRSLLVGDSSHFVVADRNGVTIKGPVSIVTGSEEIRTSGLFVSMNDLRQMLPSTIVTPGPMKLPIPPISGIANIIQDVAFFLAALV